MLQKEKPSKYFLELFNPFGLRYFKHCIELDWSQHQSVLLNDFLTDESKHFGKKQGQAAEISFYILSVIDIYKESKNLLCF